MTISKIATVIWFLLYGINYFTAVHAIGIILAVIALIIGVALFIELFETGKIWI